MYLPSFANSTKTLLGVVSPVIQTSILIGKSMTSLDNFATAAVYDLNTTDFETSFMFNSRQYGFVRNNTYQNLIEMNAFTNQQYVLSAPYTLNYTLKFADRVWQITFMPTNKFTNMYVDTFMSYVGVIISIVAWFLSLIICCTLYFIRRLRKAHRDRVKDDSKINVLNRFLSSSWLDVANIKSIRELKPMTAKTERMIMMSVTVDGYDQIVRLRDNGYTVECINEFYLVVKRIVTSKGGAIHRYDGTNIICLFKDVMTAIDVACDMQQEVGKFQRIKIAIHCGEVIMGILGDVENLLFGAMSNDLDVLNRVGCIKNSAKIVLSKTIFDEILSVSPKLTKLITLVGRVHTTDDASQHIDIFQLSDESESVLVVKRFGTAMRKVMNKDFVGALDVLNSIPVSQHQDQYLCLVKTSLQRRVSLCQKLSEKWELSDTIEEYLVVRPAFEFFCVSEKCESEIQAFMEVREYNKYVNKRKEKLADIISTYFEEGSEFAVKPHLITFNKDSVTPETLSTATEKLYEYISQVHQKFKK
ncbi:1 TM domain-containing transmembrane protein [Acrasis kona]|uniref:1 TM domain-containing transmembrane protein n=1 Tax=Acrasis kona TaxID=1008807 RepID=A0AAW2YNP2_9EUKA